MTQKRVSLAEQGLSALPINWDVVAALVLFFASFALYARTAAPGVLDGDFGEFQTNIYLLGVSHTGYPLYFLLAKLWTLLMPVGTIAFRANVFSGFLAALSLVLLYFTFRTLYLSFLVSLFASALFGVSRVFWSQAVIPDVYTLNSFFIVLVLWLAILWRMGRVPLWYVALAFGFSLTHHRTMIWIAPALAVFVLWSSARILLQPREMLKIIAALFLPLLLYLYIPLRGSSDVGVEYHASNFTEMILASNVSVWLRFGPPGFIWERITQVYLTLLVEQFTLVGFAFGIVGILALAINRAPKNFPLPARQFLVLIGLAHIAETAFAIVFWVVDSEIFFIPSYLTFLFFIAIGFGTIFDAVPSRLKGTGKHKALPLRLTFDVLRLAVFTLALAALCAYLAWTNFPRNNQSNNDFVEARWRDVLAQPLEENALFMATWEDLTPLEYFQYVENLRRDLKRRKVVIYQDHEQVVGQGDLSRDAQELLNQGANVYLTRHPDDTETFDGFEKFDVASFASLWRVLPRVKRHMETRETFGEQEELRAWSLAPRELRAGDFVTLLLNWSPDGGLQNIRLVLRMRDEEEHVWFEREIFPLGGRAVKRGGEAIRDAQGFFIPPDAPPGTYTLELFAFERNSQNPVALVGGSNRGAREFKVSANSDVAENRLQIPRPLASAVGAAKFLGYDVTNSEPRGGDVLEFSTWWQNIARADEAFEIKLRDANDAETILYQGALFPNARGEWNSAQVVRARQNITIPPQAAAGYARILLSLNGQALSPLRIPLAESKRKFRVPIIARPQLTLVGDAIQLLGYKLDRAQFRAGENLPFTLYWSAHKTPDTSYKVFVHLLDANGVLRAQRDSVPQNGALPTNRWFPGEYIADEYVLNLPNDLAAGEYRIVAGMYDEATTVRVPLFDANNARIPNDAVTLGDGIQIR